MEIKIQEIQLKALGDGYLLGATLYSLESPPNDAPVVLISSGMAIARQFYGRFAKFLVSNGVAAVLTYDYRGFGGSLPKGPNPLASLKATIMDFAEKDQPAAIKYLARTFPMHPLVYIGHSIGGLLFPMAPGRDLITRVLMVSSLTGYWQKLRNPLRDYFCFQLAHKLMTPWLGYFPSKRLGLFENLPAGVASEWLQWMSLRDYIVEDPKRKAEYASFTQPIMAISYSDDELGKFSAFQETIGWFRGDSMVWHHVDIPSQTEKHVGHMGFFFESSKNVYWQDSLQWILHGVRPDKGTSFKNSVQARL